MPILEILNYPSDILLKPASLVDNFDHSLDAMTQDMMETMYAAPGIGLAANQVGISLRVAVIDVSSEKEKSEPRILVNPKILSYEGVQLEEEGCLSLPGFTEIVERPAKIAISAFDLNGKEFIIEGKEVMARALSHEIDHLDGKLFLHRLSALKRDSIKRKIRKMMKLGEWPGINP